MTAQLAFDFDLTVQDAPMRAPRRCTTNVAAELARKEAFWAEQRMEILARARSHWRVGMVTSLPCFATVQDSGQRYTQMLPGVVEAIADDKASVRIYAAPEYGYTIDGYELHKKLAIDVPITELGYFHRNGELEKIVADGRLEAGDPELGAEVRARIHQRSAA